MSLERDKDLEKLVNDKVVYERSSEEPFESPAKTIEVGSYYKNVEERLPEVAEEEIVDAIHNPETLHVDRRDFMRLFSATAVLASTAACVQRPLEKAIPYQDQPVDQVPGVPVYYASTCAECAAGCGIVVKTREGRPTKIEGNPKHPLSQGATCALGQSTVQALFHPDRRHTPAIRFMGSEAREVSWDDVFERMGNHFKSAKNVGIFTGGSTGHRLEFYREWLTKMGFNGDNVFTYEPQSAYATQAAAYKLAFGVDGIARTELARTELIVGVGAEFLDHGVAPVYEMKSWSAGHSYRGGALGKLIQFEPRLTSTGGKAATRYPIAPGDELAVSLLLVQALLKSGGSKASEAEKSEIRKVVDAHQDLMQEAQQRLQLNDATLAGIAKEMLSKRSIMMVSSSGATYENSTMIHVAGIMGNILVGAFGQTIFIDRGWLKVAAKPGDFSRFLEALPTLDTLFVIDADPIFSIPDAYGVKDLFKKVPHIISIQAMPNETDDYASYVLNGHSPLESWGDEQPVAGFYSIRQPTVRAVTNSRQAEDILLWAAAATGKSMPYREYRDYLMEKWSAVHKLVGANVDFNTFFKAVCRRGFVGKLEQRTTPKLGSIAAAFKATKPASGLKVIAHIDNRLYDGRASNRPILQEVGDAMTTVAWDTWVGMNPHKAKELGFRYNQIVKVEGPNGTISAPLYPYPGLHPDTVVIPRGNGHTKGISRVTDDIGVNPLPILTKAVDSVTGDPVTAGQIVKITATADRRQLPAMQKSADIGNRTDIIKTMTLSEARSSQGKSVDLDEVPDLYPKLPQAQYRWGMAVDLGKCIGCSACMVACSMENNIPQIGRKEVRKGREMHWIRLDRYFAGDINNPVVTFQPMMCQQCNHAPCEGVCPVFATTHDAEGINAMTYNRCVGTRYCANACPYKVRRFNWWTHKWNVIGEREQDRNPRPLNPDVTVRTRGVMEKCTFCVQRIRDGKHAAKERGADQQVFDGEIRTACEQVCPTDAIVFGNLNDPNSRISQARRDQRAYLVLGGAPEHGHYGLKTLPNVSYLGVVNHDDSAAAAMGGHGHGHDLPHGEGAVPHHGYGTPPSEEGPAHAEPAEPEAPAQGHE